MNRGYVIADTLGDSADSDNTHNPTSGHVAIEQRRFRTGTIHVPAVPNAVSLVWGHTAAIRFPSRSQQRRMDSGPPSGCLWDVCRAVCSQRGTIEQLCIHEIEQTHEARSATLSHQATI